jgi:DNA-binding response OmpR family regulator
MLTARGGAEHMSAGYQSGADVYLVKPVSPTVLLAAIASVQRRLPEPLPAGNRYTLAVAALRLEGPAGAVVVNAAEAAVLAGLMRSPQRRLDSFQIAALMGQSEEQFNKPSLEIRLVRLRKKLVAVGVEPGCLQAQRGIGYQLCIPIDLI